ncbi:hypothetical protein REPUB_Repub06bG0016100 [Reevesia pubescens]
MDIANAVAYLHTALSRPIIHRGLPLISIVLDSNFVAKLSDFSLSIAIPEGKSHVKDAISGIKGYMAPEVLEAEAILEEFVQFYVESNLLFEIVDENISSEGINHDELVAFAKLALNCTQKNPEDRPTITDVAKQLRQLYKTSPSIP